MKIIDCNAIIDPGNYYQLDNLNAIESDTNVFKNILEPSIEVLENKGVLVYPTDTIYALGVNALDPEALEKIPALKQRPGSMPISIAVADLATIEKIAVISPIVRDIYNIFLPGALTLILEVRPDIELELPKMIVSESNKIGIRVPKHSLALTLIKRFGKPLTATSANLHNKPIPINISTSIEQLDETVDIYLNCGECKYQGESTILEVADDTIKLIREGVISRSELELQLEVPING